MKSPEIAAISVLLGDEIVQLAAQYHVKSDEHDILPWEADIIRAKSKDLVENCGRIENIKESTLLSAWGSSLAAKIPNVVDRAKYFHASYSNARKFT
ncbi:MAG TPA: hypothetical protein VIZ65_00050 [Cellvibrionaceae bacterium]